MRNAISEVAEEENLNMRIFELRLPDVPKSPPRV